MVKALKRQSRNHIANHPLGELILLCPPPKVLHGAITLAQQCHRQTTPSLAQFASLYFISRKLL